MVAYQYSLIVLIPARKKHLTSEFVLGRTRSNIILFLSFNGVAVVSIDDTGKRVADQTSHICVNLVISKHSTSWEWPLGEIFMLILRVVGDYYRPRQMD